MHLGAVGKFLAGAFDNFFQFQLGFLEFLLLEESQGLVIELHLRLDTRVNHFNAAALGRLNRG